MVVLALIARPLRIAQPVVLVLGGLVLALTPLAPDAHVDPEIVLFAFLPAILFPSAIAYAREDVRPALRPVSFLAVGLVLATTAAVAGAVQLTLDVGWPAAVVVGAVLAPTDPISATALLRGLGAPSRLATILEGESLINDGTSLTLFSVAIGAVGGGFALGAAFGDFVLIAAGGAAVGAVLGWAAAEVLRRVDDVETESALAVLTAYGSYLLAEELAVSGILATVVAGFVIGTRMTDITSPETRLRSGSFWALLEFLAVSMLFVLVGLFVGDAIGTVGAEDVGRIAGATAAVSAVVLATRLGWMVTVPHLVRLAIPGKGRPYPTRELIALVAGGMRGAVSVAAALAIPLTAGGAPFPERDVLVLVALLAVVVLLVVPAVALPRLLRALDLAGGRDAPDERAIRTAMTEAALARLDDIETGDGVERARDEYRHRLRALQTGDDRSAEERGRRRRVLLDAIEAERAELNRLNEEGSVAGGPLRDLERELDREERRLSR